ncbi:dihydroneopterin aldolase [Peijinzhouia sedimentorum]
MKYKLAPGEVRLKSIEFFAFHGVQAEEQKIGNRYVVDISAKGDLGLAAKEDNLNGTIDYCILYRITREVMTQPAKLLEHLAFKIAEKALNEITLIDSIEVKVAKMNPPIGALAKESSATLTLSR